MNTHPVVTFDLPIWIKSVDIIKSKKLPVIPRLGGFHLLKSFLGTCHSIFADSGLHELVQLIYPGSTVADSILNGGSYDKAIRSHFLIDAAIVQHVIPSDMFSDQEFSQMEATIASLVENKTGSLYQDLLVVKSFQKKIEEVFVGGAGPRHPGAREPGPIIFSTHCRTLSRICFQSRLPYLI